MALATVTPPTIEPISLNAARDYLRVDHTDDDSVIAGLIAAARARYDARGILGRALMTQTLDYWVDAFPVGRALFLPVRPVQSIVSVSYLDASQTLIAADAASYVASLASEPPRIYPVGGTWPATACVPDSVVVRLVAGVDDPGLLPADLIQAMKINIAYWYDCRDEPSGLDDPPGDRLALGTRLTWPV